MEVHGHCAEEFAPVRDAFRQNFAEGLELGASVAVSQGGVVMVDLWGGDADTAGTPWAEDAIVNVFSVTKDMTAICVLMLVDRDLVDVEGPVAAYWPEFAANGKETVTVRHVLAHTSGIAGFDEPMRVEALYDWDLICDRLVAQKPWWEPGTAWGYSSFLGGYVLGEIVRRVTGSTLGQFFRDEVAEPLGADFHIGLDAQHDQRVGELVPPPMTLADMAASAGPDSLPGRMIGTFQTTGWEPATRAWRAAEIPSAGGFGNARSVDRVHAALACGGSLDGVTLMSPKTVELALEEDDPGEVLIPGDIRHGLGFAIESENVSLPPRAFFGRGWSGAHAVVDLDSQLSIAYVMNRMADDIDSDVRAPRLIEAAYTSIVG